MKQKNNYWWFWFIILIYIALIFFLSKTNLGSIINSSKQWFWMSFIAMILNSIYVISFQFFSGPKYRMEPSVQHASFSIGNGIGAFFIGITLGVIPLKEYFNVIPVTIIALMGLLLTGSISNLMVSMAVRTKNISPSLPFVVSNSSNFLTYVLASVLGIAFPLYFKEASWNIWSGFGVATIIISLMLIKEYGLSRSKKGSNVEPTQDHVIRSSDSRLRYWLLEGNWFFKSFVGMIIITIYLVSFQFFGHFFCLDPLVQHSIYVFFMGLGIFMYSKIFRLFSEGEYKKYTPMAIVFLMGLIIGGWLTTLVMVALRIPDLNPGLPFIIANSFVVLTYIVGHLLAIKLKEFNRTIFNWQTILAMFMVLISLLLIKIFG